VLHGGPDPPTERGRQNWEKFLPIVNALHISETVEARDLKVCVHIEGWGPKENYAKVDYRG